MFHLSEQWSWEKYNQERSRQKLNMCMITQIRKSLRGDLRGKNWEYLVGYTLDDLKKHLEKQFKHGMTWANQGQWHIDHIIPKSIFNFSKPEHIDFRRCWALENLQPLWRKENLIKHAKIKEAFQPSFNF